jgi:hypothetical protein
MLGIRPHAGQIHNRAPTPFDVRRRRWLLVVNHRQANQFAIVRDDTKAMPTVADSYVIVAFVGNPNTDEAVAHPIVPIEDGRCIRL